MKSYSYTKNLTFSIFFLVFAIVVPMMVCEAQAAQAGLSPEEILAQADLARGNTKGLEWVIAIESVEKGRKRSQTLKLKAVDYTSLAEFRSPAKVKGRKLLMKDRNMWFIKPGLSKPVPISPRQKLLGGASNGDIASTNYAGDYQIEAFGKGEHKDEACWLFDLKAKNKKVTYDRIRYWVSKTRLVGVKAEFFTLSGKMFKTATFRYENSIQAAAGGTNSETLRPFVSEMRIVNAVIPEDVTTMAYSRVRLAEIPPATFNLNLLVR